jgi:RHS repeat-associated protein
LFAGAAIRSASNGYSGDLVRQKFDGYERDNETGLDFAEARYFASIQGRFTSPDDVLNDSHPADPQSWNLYACVRNNPLKYIDPTGRNVTVTYDIDEKNKKGTITITASIAIYASDKLKSTGVYNLGVAAKSIKSGIQETWSGEFKRDGITYTVKTEVNVQIADDKQGAINTGAQNVIEIAGVNEISTPGEGMLVGLSGRDPANRDAPYDFGRWIPAINGTDVGHEWGHLLGIGDRDKGKFLMNKKTREGVSGATNSDYEWAFGEHIDSRRPLHQMFATIPGVYPKNGPPQSGTFTKQLRAGRYKFMDR